MRPARYFLIFLFLFSSVCFATTWYYSNFSLNTTADNSVDDCRLYLEFNHSEKVAAGKSQADASDIYITDSTGSTYWEYDIEVNTNNTASLNMSVWILPTSCPDKATLLNGRIYYSGSASALHVENTTGVWDNNNFSIHLSLGEASGTRYDSTSYSNDATPTNTPVQAVGKFGYGQDMEAGDVDYFVVSDAASLSFGDGSSDEPFSISMWVKIESSSTGYGILTKYGTDNREYFVTVPNGNQMSITYWDNSADARRGRRDTATTLTPGNWHHIVGTYNGNGTASGGNLYLNGVNVDDADHATGSYTAMEDKSEDVRIGVAPYNLAKTVDGIIDDVRLYRKELSQDEIDIIYGQTWDIGAETAVGGGGGAGNVTIELLNPANDYSTYYREIEFQYNVTTNNNTNCFVYIDEANLYNDSVTTGSEVTYQFNHTRNMSLGDHNWSVYCNQSDGVSDDNSSLYNFTVASLFGVTLWNPAEAYSTYGKEVNLTYNVSSNDYTSCYLYADGALLNTETMNPSSPTNYTYGYLHNFTYGDHQWNVSCNHSALTNNSVIRNLTVDFDISLNAPSNGTNLAVNYTTLSYTTTNNYDIICNTTLDGSVVNSTNVTSSEQVNVSVADLTNGTYSWYVRCYGGDNPSYNQTSSTWTFTLGLQLLDEVVNLTNTSHNVLSNPQAIFYDILGNLNVLYYVDDPAGKEVYIHTVNGSTVQQTYHQEMNAPDYSFFMVFREENTTDIMTFNETYQMFLSFNSTDLYIYNYSTTINATSNSFYDPYTYANTRRYDTITYTNESYYLFMLSDTVLPDRGFFLYRKNASSHVLEEIDSQSGTDYISWGTIANSSDLSEWYYAFPEPTPHSNAWRIFINHYDGASTSLVAILENNTLSNAELEKTVLVFEGHGESVYVMATNYSTYAQLMEVTSGKNVTLNYSISNPSHFFFVDDDTFVFFSEEGSDTYAYSCYFGAENASCIRFGSSDYGATVPYERGYMATAKTDSDEDDVVTKGNIVSSDVVQLFYTQDTYDTKFLCYDEVDEFRKNFTVDIYADNSSIIFKNTTWGYVLPSDLTGSGTKRAYFTCSNGTTRLFIVGLDSNYQIDSYSLNTWQGEYYTFVVYDKWGSPVSDARISAYRFSTLKQEWVVVEQAISDYSGAGTLFLEQFTLYQIYVEYGAVLLDFDFVPATIYTINIQLQGDNETQVLLPNYEYIWDDVSYSIVPEDSHSLDPIDIEFSVASNSSQLQYFGMQVEQGINGTKTVVYTSNITTQPSGGHINYTTVGNGTFYVTTWLKHQNYSEHQPFTKTYFVTPTSGLMKAKQDYADNSPISGWGMYFFALVCAALVGGYVYQYTEDGAGIAVILTLAIFTWFMPDVALVCIGGISSACITPTHTTVLTAIAVGAAMFVRRSL